MRHLVAAGLGALLLASPSLAADITIATPSDDRWVYPFNFSFPPGSRATGSMFTVPPGIGLDYRDAEIALRFRTQNTDSLAADYIPTGLAPQAYEFTTVTLTVYHNSGTYTWDTRNPAINAAGKPFALEVFGFGVDAPPAFTGFTTETWNENSPFFGQSQGVSTPAGQRRNPFPLSVNQNDPELSEANDINATPWGFGFPVYGTNPGEYTPGVAASVPFPITYTLDVSNPRVRAYIQEGLSRGRIEWILSSTALAGGMGPPPPVIPVIIMKESAAAPDPAMTIQGLTTNPSVPSSTSGSWSVLE